MINRKPQVILTRSEHNVSRKNIDPDALKVLYRLNRFGYLAFLVGGGVRDLLLERQPKDFDISTDATPNQIRKIFKNCFLIGRRFRLAHIRFGQKVIETSTFRRKPEPVDSTNAEESSLYQNCDNTFGTPQEDAWRRDFTINGLFYDINHFKIIDYVGGLKDLRKKVIRTIGDPDVRLNEDPVRMLRAIRFASRLNFKIDPKTWKSILRNHEQILKSSPPRICEEIQRLFAYGSGTQAMRLMEKSGLLSDLLPSVSSYLSRVKDKGKFFWKCLKALDVHKDAGQAPATTMIFAAMCYPLFVEELQRRRVKDSHVISLVVAREVLQGVMRSLAVPNWVLHRVANAFDLQRRLEGWGKDRFSKNRLVAHESFIVAAFVYDIQAEARGLKGSDCKPWMTLYHELGLPVKPASGKASPRRPARRRGRRRRFWKDGRKKTTHEKNKSTDN